MAPPTHLRIERPYPSLDAFLDGDAWTVDRTDMVLVGATAVAAGAAVKFEIVLTTGEPVVSGEGRAVEEVSPRDGRPGGLRVRFRQLDASSKAVLRRALEAQKRASAAQPAPPPSATTPAAVAAPAEATPRAAPEAPPDVPGPSVGPTPSLDAATAAAPERSGVRHSPPGPTSAPGNRDALLDRLRARAAGVVKVSASAPPRQTRKTAAE